jgi:hypothetical protein
MASSPPRAQSSELGLTCAKWAAKATRSEAIAKANDGENGLLRFQETTWAQQPELRGGEADVSPSVAFHAWDD